VLSGITFRRQSSRSIGILHRYFHTERKRRRDRQPDFPPAMPQTPPAVEALTGTGVNPQPHSVDLTWTASTSSGVVGYNIYRSVVSGSGYTSHGTLNSDTSYTEHQSPRSDYLYVESRRRNDAESGPSCSRFRNDAAVDVVAHDARRCTRVQVRSTLCGCGFYAGAVSASPLASLRHCWRKSGWRSRRRLRSV